MSTASSPGCREVLVANADLSPIRPFWIRTEEVAQHYPTLWKGIIGSYAVLVLVAVMLYVMLRRENRRRDALSLDEKEGEKHAFDDLSDKENMYFRYAY